MALVKTQDDIVLKMKAMSYVLAPQYFHQTTSDGSPQGNLGHHAHYYDHPVLGNRKRAETQTEACEEKHKAWQVKSISKAAFVKPFDKHW